MIASQHVLSLPPSTQSGARRRRPARGALGARRAVRSIAIGVAAVAGLSVGLAVDSGSASALPELPAVVPTAALPTNAMAPIVTSSAREALESYDNWMTTGDAVHERAYVWYRTQTAQYAATELGYPRDEMVGAWAATPVGHQLAVLAAMTQVGVPYRYNTSTEGVGFDCSGLTTFAWARAGQALVRQSSAQINAAARVDREAAKAGDLVQYPGHVMMYLGVGDAIIHSVRTGRTVELDTINTRRTSSVRFGDPAA